MKKLRDVLDTAVTALRCSLAFCLRNDRKDTIWEMSLSLVVTVIGYFVIVATGHLVSVLQSHLASTKTIVFTINQFVETKTFGVIALLVGLMFADVVVSRFRGAFGSRRRQMLRRANDREIKEFLASLDIGRKRSKEFDDLDRKISELPVGYYTRIDFAGQTMELFATTARFLMFGIPLALLHPVYVLILLAASLPMLYAESAVVNRNWQLQLELIPVHKRRSVFSSAFYGTTAFLQGLMFNQHGFLQQQIRDNHQIVLDKTDEVRWSNIQLTLVAYAVAVAGLWYVMGHAAWHTMGVTAGDIGALTVLIVSARNVQSTLRDIVSQMASQWINAKGVIMIEREYFGMEPMIRTRSPVVPDFRGPPEIRFEGVSFKYPDQDSLALKNVSFTIKPGSKTAVIGKNGSGKSSLMGLMLRFYDPTSGAIYAGNVPLSSIEPSAWSKWISALLQSFTIQNRLVGEEIASSRLGDPVDFGRVTRAAQMADFMKVVEADPQGFDSQIGTEFDGREFSGGEEQRLAFAKAIYAGTPILILDEPDAKLDVDGAQKIFDNVYAMTGVTIIIVTQHVRRAERCDQVLVLHQGELVESGTPDELVSRNGRFASMVQKDKKRANAED